MYTTYVALGLITVYTLLIFVFTCCVVRPKVRYEQERLQNSIGTVVIQNIRNRPWYEEIVDYGPHKLFTTAKSTIPSNPKRNGKKNYFDDVAEIAQELKTGQRHRA